MDLGVGSIIGLFMIGIIGVALVLGFYLVWSRMMKGDLRHQSEDDDS